MKRDYICQVQKKKNLTSYIIRASSSGSVTRDLNFFTSGKKGETVLTTSKKKKKMNAEC